MPKRAPSLIFLTGFHSESENLGVLSDSSHEPIIRHCWHCCILRYERTRQGAGLAYDAVADGWARRQKASLGPPSLSLSLVLSSFRNAVEEVVKSRARSLFLASLARPPAVSSPATIFYQSDLKKVSTLSAMSLTFQIDHASPRQQSKNLWFSVLRFSPLSDFPPSNCSPLGQREEGAPACRVRVIISNMTSQSVETNPSLARSKSGRFVRSFVRSAPVCQQISLFLSLVARAPSGLRRERERVCRSRPRRGVN